MLIPFFASGQVHLSGTVVNSKGLSLEGVILTAYTEAQEIAGYTMSDEQGRFSLQIETKAANIQLAASLMGYEKKTFLLVNNTQSIRIELKAKEVELKEVHVKADLTWKKSDTLVYNVAAFQEQQDRTIGDLLKKLPGIEVTQNGTVKYNGEAINKFYIEGMDLMDKKYGIATNNLPVDAVQNVEIYENHQPVKSLQNIFHTGKAAINIKLKGNKLSRPIGAAELGGGLDEERAL